MIDLTLILAAGVASGTILLFAAIGEIFAERAGVLNLGVEGMMLVGARGRLHGRRRRPATPGSGCVVAMLAGGAARLAPRHVAIHFQADQVVSGLALTFLGTGLAWCSATGCRAPVRRRRCCRRFTIPLLSDIPLLGRVFFTDQSVLVYVGYLLVPLAWYWIDRTRPGLHLRAVGEQPHGRRRPGHQRRTGCATSTCWSAALLAGLAGATISLAISPGWFGDQTTSGPGWIAVGLVIFAQWSPLRAALGAYLFGALFRLILDLQGAPTILGIPNPFHAAPRRSSSRCCRTPSSSWCWSSARARRSGDGWARPRRWGSPTSAVSAAPDAGRTAAPSDYSSSLGSSPSSSIWT